MYFSILPTEKIPTCLYVVIWYNFHHGVSAVGTDYTDQNSDDFAKQMNLWSLLLLFLFSTK